MILSLLRDGKLIMNDTSYVLFFTAAFLPIVPL